MRQKYHHRVTRLILSVFAAIAFFLAAPKITQAATYTVTNTSDSGAGSFRQAVSEANSNSGADQINFNIPGAGPHTITFGSGIASYGPLTVNGLSQSGSVCDGPNTELMIRFNLNGVVNPFFFDTGAAGSELNGLAIANAGENAYAFQTVASNTIIRCNLFGTFDGTTVASTYANSDNVLVNAPGVTVGGNSQADMNLSIAPTSANHRFMFTSEATTIDFRNNVVGVSLDGTTSFPGGRMAIAAASVSRSTVNISNNLLYSDDPVATVGMSGAVNSLVANNNIIGLNASGTAAFDGGTTGLYLPGSVSDSSSYQVMGNHIAVRATHKVAIQFTAVADNVDLGNNKINVTADGSSRIEGVGGGSAAITSTSEVDNDNWNIHGNHLYGNLTGAILLRDIDGLIMTDNTIGMNLARTICFAGAKDVTIMESQNVVIGGTDPADANAICVPTHNDVLINHTGLGAVTVLGNTLLSTNSQPFNVIGGDTSDDVGSPTIIAISEDVDSTDITYRADLASGIYRIEFFENDALLNSGNYPTAKTFVGARTFPASGNPAQIFTETISATNLDFLSATITLLDGSTDGFANTSEIGPSSLEAEISIQTTDGVDSVDEGTTGHEMTQTFTNTGPASLTNMNFSLSQSDCFDITSIATSGTATDAGSYDDNTNAWSGLLEPNQTLEITFVGDVSCDSSQNIVFAHNVSSYAYNGYTVTNTADGANVNLSNSTDIAGLVTELTVETTDDIDEISVGTTGHEITQTLTNTGPTTITDIDFDLVSQNCITFQGTTQSGTATDAGNLNGIPDWLWTGILEPGQTLIITFISGEVSCGVGQETNLDFQISSLEYNGSYVTNLSNNPDYSDINTVVPRQTDLAFVTSDVDDPVLAIDPLAPLESNTHTITQTIANNGDISVDQMTFSLSSDCFNLSNPGSITVSGTATDTGSYDEGTYTWSGQLDTAQELIITFEGPLSCSGGVDVNFNHPPSSILLSSEAVNDSTNDNNDYSETTQIINAIVDLSITKTLLNPQDYAPGAELQYQISLTNNSDHDMRIDQFDGSIPGQTSLFLDIMPPDITFTGFTSSDDIGCTSYGPGSAGLFGGAMANHSDHEIVNCYETSGNKILGNRQTISGVMTVQVANDSDLQFRNYAYATFGINDPEIAYMAGYNGTTDLIDHLESQGPNNNLAKSVPVIDVTIDKELLGGGSANGGDTVSYNISMFNKGPMTIDLNEAVNQALFADIYPADALTFVSVEQDEFACQDLGPGSNAFLGNAGIDHPNHQILVCAYISESSRPFAPNDTLQLTLNFEVKNGAPDTYTNYVAATTIPTDPDVYVLNVEFGNAVGDVLDIIQSENFDKVVYVTPADQVDTDDDGITDVTEDAGPNGGDANNDGTADSEQSHVSSFVSDVTDSPVVLEVSEDCTITTVGVNNESANDSNDGSYVYPLGMMNFALSCGDPGYLANVTQYYYDQTNQNYQLRKYHPTNNEYFAINEASVAQQQIDGRSVIVATYQVQDGGALDVDGAENGNIADPAGLALIDTSAQQSEGLLSKTGDSVRLFVYSALVLFIASMTLLKIQRIRV